MSIADEQFTARKNKRKYWRTILQAATILILAVICVATLFTLKKYQPYTLPGSESAGDQGFIALSYFGVERTGSQTLIAAKRLEEHLAALQAQGYVTITQQDILRYYQEGAPLPEKALFLMFEDGRRDTAIFSQPILEKLNFKATILTYPEKFAAADTKFLMPQDLRRLEAATYWELGTNGYRLAFINVFDRYDNYLGELTPLEHAEVAPYLGRRYNHYLMDYIRDEYDIPRESTGEMQERIAADYTALQDIYSRSLGYVPGMHILMHSNTGRFGNHDKVSAENERWIQHLFKLNFNREGFALNQRHSSMYDLTRMQPQAYWSANHLLMRIKYDIRQELDFVKGDLDKQQAWEIVQGAAEVQNETIILTSLPQSSGLLRLNDASRAGGGAVTLSVRLRGNKLGLQKLYLRADEDLQRFLAVAVRNNVLYVTEKTGDTEQQLFALELDRHDGRQQLSVAEDKKAAQVRTLETFLKYARSVEEAQLYAARLQEKSGEYAPTAADGAPVYEPALSVHEPGDRRLLLSLAGDRLSIAVDGREAVANLPVRAAGQGRIYLEAAWGDDSSSRRNLADDVYDGIFEQLVITENTGAEQEKVIFDGRLRGLTALVFQVKQAWQSLIQWFIVNL